MVGFEGGSEMGCGVVTCGGGDVLGVCMALGMGSCEWWWWLWCIARFVHTQVCQLFLREAREKTAGRIPEVCCLACAGGIKDNSVSFSNVSKGWVIEGKKLAGELGDRTPSATRPPERAAYAPTT